LSADNLATVNGRNTCDMSKFQNIVENNNNNNNNNNMFITVQFVQKNLELASRCI